MHYALLGLAFVVVVVFCQDPNGPPPFLKNAPATVQNDFKRLIQSNMNLPPQQMDQKVQLWVSRQSSPIKVAFASFQKQMRAAQQQNELARQAALRRFSPAAKAADARLMKIAANPSLSPQQQQAQIQAVMTSLPANVRQELMNGMMGRI